MAGLCVGILALPETAAWEERRAKQQLEKKSAQITLPRSRAGVARASARSGGAKAAAASRAVLESASIDSSPVADEDGAEDADEERSSEKEEGDTSDEEVELLLEAGAPRATVGAARGAARVVRLKSVGCAVLIASSLGPAIYNYTSLCALQILFD